MVLRTPVGDIVWTDDLVGKLKQLKAEGCSAGVIAQRLGITRNAVIGKLNRLGVVSYHKATLRTDGTKRSPRPRVPRQIAKTPSGVGVLSCNETRTYPRQSPKPLPTFDVDAPVLSPSPVGLLELGPDHCRAILNDLREAPALFCGNPKGVDWEGKPSSFCAHHHQRFYEKPKRVRRNPVYASYHR